MNKFITPTGIKFITPAGITCPIIDTPAGAIEDALIDREIDKRLFDRLMEQHDSLLSLALEISALVEKHDANTSIEVLWEDRDIWIQVDDLEVSTVDGDTFEIKANRMKFDVSYKTADVIFALAQGVPRIV